MFLVLPTGIASWACLYRGFPKTLMPLCFLGVLNQVKETLFDTLLRKRTCLALFDG